MALWRLRIRRVLSRRWCPPSQSWSRYLSRFKQPAVFVPLGGSGLAEANVQVVSEPASRALPDQAEAIIRDARQALLDASTLAPLEDVVLQGASIKAVVANRAGERYVVTVRRVGR